SGFTGGKPTYILSGLSMGIWFSNRGKSLKHGERDEDCGCLYTGFEGKRGGSLSLLSIVEDPPVLFPPRPTAHRGISCPRRLWPGRRDPPRAPGLAAPDRPGRRALRRRVQTRPPRPFGRRLSSPHGALRAPRVRAHQRVTEH